MMIVLLSFLLIVLVPPFRSDSSLLAKNALLCLSVPKTASGRLVPSKSGLAGSGFWFVIGMGFMVRSSAEDCDQ